MAHSEHHSQPKKANFIAPLVMGLSFWLFAFFFLSLCDGPSHGHEGEDAHSGHSQEQMEKSAEVKSEEKKEESKEIVGTDSSKVDSVQSVEIKTDSVR